MHNNAPSSNQRIGTAIGFVNNVQSIYSQHKGYLVKARVSLTICFPFSLQKRSQRVLTQHGLSGLPGGNARVGTSVGMRQIKDSRYWQSQLQMKMDEIRRETERLVGEKQNMDREKSAKRTFDKRAKEATRELTGMESYSST